MSLKEVTRKMDDADCMEMKLLPRRKTKSVELNPLLANAVRAVDIEAAEDMKLTFLERETVPSLLPVSTAYFPPPLCICI